MMRVYLSQMLPHYIAHKKIDITQGQRNTVNAIP